jgi:hypothetical protein
MLALAIAMIASSSEVACRRSSTRPSDARAQGSGGAVLSDANLDGIVLRLGDPDESRRSAALDELRALAKKGVSVTQGQALLRAAAKTYPPEKYKFMSTQGDLIRTAAITPDISYVPIVKEIFPSLSSRARAEAFQLLAAIDDKQGAIALLELLEGAVASGAPPSFTLPALEKSRKFPDVYFPRILQSARGEAESGVFSLCLAYASAGAVSPATLGVHAVVVIDAYRPLREKALAAQKPTGTSWLWEDEYVSTREDAGLLLDLMGYFPSPPIEPLVREAAKLKDPKLAYFGAISSLRLGMSVDADTLERVAASAEVRGWLFDGLGRLGKRSLFPTRWATQAALAEAEMVNWLTYPTEMGRAPDEIELMNVVSEDVGPRDGVMEWYLFRFRTNPPHWSSKDGWLAGVAGPFRKAKAPSTASYGDTFSSMKPWSSMTPEQHVADVRAIIANWKKHAAGASHE